MSYPIPSSASLPLMAKPLVVLLCSLPSSSAWAWFEPLQTMSPQIFNGLVFAVLFVFLGLAISLLVLNGRVKARERSLAESNKDKQLIKEQIDRSVSGLLQLDKSGTILYANAMAAYFFERKIEQLIGASFVGVCPETITGDITASLEQTREAHIHCHLGHYRRHARMRLSPHKKPIGEVTTSIVIDDIDAYQQRIDEQKRFNANREQAIELAGIGVCSLHFDDGTLTLNAALCQLLELDAQQELCMERFSQYVDSDDSIKWEHCIKQLREGQVQTFRGQLRIKEGLVPVRIDGQPHSSADSDDVFCATLIVTNLTKIEQLKQQAELSQKQIKTMMGASPLPVYLLNAKKQLIDCNQPFCSLFKLQLNSVKNKSIEDIGAFPHDLKALHVNTQGIGARCKPASVTLSDEQQLDINLHLLSYKQNNEHAGTVAIIEDLTAIKVLQQQVSANEEALSSLIDQSPLGIAVFNHEDKLTRVNSTLADILKKDKESLQKQTFYQLFKNPDQAGTAARLLHQTGFIRDFSASLVQADEQALSTRLDVSKLQGSEAKYVCWIADARNQQYLSDQLERLITYSNMPIGLLSSEGFTKLNPAACAFFDAKSEDDLLGLSPASEILNPSAQSAEEMSAHLARLEEDKKVTEFSWVHQHKGDSLPCEITLVPLFYQQQHTATLCLWVDLRALEKANEARLEAVNLRQAAEREIAEKQQLLQNSQDLLASRARSLHNTQEKLEAAENDLATKMDTIRGLQQAHEDISGHLKAVQNDYERNLQLLTQSQQANAELEAQLQESGDKVSQLQKQRNQIADALQHSERSHRQAQEKLAASEQAKQRLKEEQAKQQASLHASQQQIDSLKHSIASKDKQIQDVSGQINSLQSQLVSSAQVSEKLRDRLVNQRKASETAEQKRRELELTCQSAQAELANKSSHVEHLQHEMQMLEQMSQQQKGDMEKQTQQLEQELAAKQRQLDATAEQLSQAKQQSEQEKQHSAAREAELEQLKSELQEVETRRAAQQQKISETDEKWQQQQAALQNELKAKQQQLQQITEQFNNTQQQTDEERAQQKALVTKLESELQDVEQRAAAQMEKIAQSDQQWKEKQQALADELATKKAQLNETQKQLDEHQRQMDMEKLARKAQQDKLVQLKQEMADVESRAAKQREMMEGNDEQRRQYYAEIEKQKQQLQHALERAEAQNQDMQAILASKLEALKGAESTVSRTQSDEQKLQAELSAAREQAEALQDKLNRQEEQEKQLKQQVAEQQNSLQQREDNIHALQQEQQRLTEALRSVKQEYAQSKASLNDQDSSQQQLTEQLKTLESELKNSQQQLNDKESALKEAQELIASHASKLSEQENALIEAQKEELKQANAQQSGAERPPTPEFAKLPMPDEPEVWFELLPYLQNKQGVTSLATVLQQLIDDVQSYIDSMDKALEDDNERNIHLTAYKLKNVLETIPSAPLSDMAKKLEYFCENRFTDNIAIGWPAYRAQLMSTLRVIYSHLHGQND